MRKFMVLMAMMIAGVVVSGCACGNCQIDPCDTCVRSFDELGLEQKLAHPDVKAGKEVKFDDGIIVRDWKPEADAKAEKMKPAKKEMKKDKKSKKSEKKMKKDKKSNKSDKKMKKDNKSDKKMKDKKKDEN